MAWIRLENWVLCLPEALISEMKTGIKRLWFFVGELARWTFACHLNRRALRNLGNRFQRSQSAQLLNKVCDRLRWRSFALERQSCGNRSIFVGCTLLLLFRPLIFPYSSFYRTNSFSLFTSLWPALLKKQMWSISVFRFTVSGIHFSVLPHFIHLHLLNTILWFFPKHTHAHTHWLYRWKSWHFFNNRFSDCFKIFRYPQKLKNTKKFRICPDKYERIF